MAYGISTFTSQYSGVAVPELGTVGDDLLRINDVDEDFSFLNDGASILYRMLTMYNKLPSATQPQYWFFEDDQYEVKTTLASAYTAAGGLTITLTDAIAVAGSVLFVPSTSDKYLVTAVTGAACTVEEDYMGTTASDIADGAEVWLLGTTLDEGGAAKGGIANLPTKVDNYISFFSNTIQATDVQEMTEMVNGVGQLSREYAMTTLWVMRQMDQALRHSGGLLDAVMAAGTGPAYYTKGLDQYITTDAELPATGMSWYDLNEAFGNSFLPTNSSPEKTLVLSQYAFSILNKVAWDRWTANPAFEKTLGAKLGTLLLDTGDTIDVIVDKYGFPSNGVGTQGYLLDLPYVGVKPMDGFDLKWREITLPNAHSMTHEIFGSTSLCVKHGADLHRTISFA